MRDLTAYGAAGAPSSEGVPDAVEIEKLVDWLLSEALGETTPERLLAGTAERLVKAGLPLLRVQMGYRVLHPLYHGFTVSWTQAGGAEKTGHLYEEGRQSTDWLASPYYFMLSRGEGELRRDLSSPDAASEFPIFDTFRALGGTDYFAKSITFVNEGAEMPPGIQDDGLPGTDGVLMSWLCGRAEGFAEPEIKVLRRIQKRLAVAAKMDIRRQTIENVVNAYLGPQVGKRVLDGQIQRGSGEDMTAVIWFCDLTGSTVLADSMPRSDFLALLNDFLEVMANAVHGRGGQVLRYIGDAALAIFPVGEVDCPDGVTKCGTKEIAVKAALNAALDARKALNRLNAERKTMGREALCFTVGLHLGEILYGNIGSPDRVEFTVTGAAANEAARIQSKCKELDSWCLISAAVQGAGVGGQVTLVSKGKHALRGVEKPVELFAVI